MSEKEKIELELSDAVHLVESYVDEPPIDIEYLPEGDMSVRYAVNYLRDMVLDILMYCGEDDLEVEDTLNSWDYIDKIICRIITGKLKKGGKPITRLVSEGEAVE